MKGSVVEGKLEDVLKLLKITKKRGKTEKFVPELKAMTARDGDRHCIEQLRIKPFQKSINNINKLLEQQGLLPPLLSLLNI